MTWTLRRLCLTCLDTGTRVEDVRARACDYAVSEINKRNL